MKVQAATDKRTYSTDQMLQHEISPLTIPIRELDEGELLVCGFRQNMLEMGDGGGVDTGAGLGSDFIMLRWGKRTALVRGSELLKAWVNTFDAESAARFPEEVKGFIR